MAESRVARVADGGVAGAAESRAAEGRGAESSGEQLCCSFHAASVSAFGFVDSV